MVSNTQEREWRINEALKIIPFKETPKVKVALTIMDKLQCSKRLAQEYIEILMHREAIEGNKTEIWCK
jgi:hypothetical protein